MTYVLLSLIGALILALMATILYYRHQIASFSRRFGETLDELLADRMPALTVTGETLLDKLNLKIKRLYEMLHDRTAASEKSKEQVQSLISDISHQVKTPVANLRMYSQILQERQLSSEEQRQFLSLIASQAEKLDFLMQSLLKSSRLENGMINFSPGTVSVEKLLAEALLPLMTAAEDKGLLVTVDCPSHLTMACDERWTKEALFNLLDNSVKYTSTGGSIAIRGEQDPFFAAIYIANTGPCIPEAEQVKIFQRFYRSENVKNLADGAGLGLFLARQIISRQGGSLQVRSEPPLGAEFILRLPR